MAEILVPQKIPALLGFTAVHGHAIHVRPENVWARCSATIYLIQRPLCSRLNEYPSKEISPWCI